MSILGNRVVRIEDPKLLTSGGTYIDDLVLEGAAFVTYVRSPMAHARIVAIDIADALAAPGVVAVITAADVDLEPFPLDIFMLPSTMPRSFLASDVVRFVGEPVVAVLTEERYQGEDAAELVVVDYEPLPVVVDPDVALTGEVLLFPEVGTNVCFEIPGEGLSFDDCEVVVEARINNPKVAPCPLEVRVAASTWEGDKLVHWSSSQGAHPVRDRLCQVYGLAADKVRVITPDVGGGFGAKGFSYPEELLCPWLSRHLGRPVRWFETRSESMLGLGHGRGQMQDVKIGGTRDGKVLAYRLSVVQDTGAYPRMSAILPFLTRMMLTGTYDIPAAECVARSVVTNTVPMVAYRGAGRPEAAAAIERAMDLFAAEIGMDPAEVRRRNVVAASAFPFTTPTGTTYDSGQYGTCARPRARGVRVRGAAGRAGSAPGGRRGADSWESASRSTWRSPRCRGAPSTPTCRCSRAGRCGRSRAPRPTVKVTTRRGRCSSASAWASRSTPSRWCTATPTSCRRAA